MNDYKYQVMPNLSADEYAELREDIKRRGVMVPQGVLDGLDIEI